MTTTFWSGTVTPWLMIAPSDSRTNFFTPPVDFPLATIQNPQQMVTNRG